MRFVISTALVVIAINCRSQQLIATWPLSDPVAYLYFYDDGTLQKDTPIQFNYRTLNSDAIINSSTGELLFQTNGGVIVNKQFVMLQNGYDLNDPIFNTSVHNSAGMTESQGVICLPKKGNTYYVFTLSFTDSLLMSGNGSPDRMYYAVVDMDADSGRGAIVQKRMPIYKGIMGDCRITACKHGNGRDYWLVNHGYNNNCYNKWLVTPDSVYGPFNQCIGTPHIEPDIIGMAKFNEEGSQYVMGSGNGLVNLMDFDRCTGEFSNYKTINVYPDPLNSGYLSSISGVEFSLSGRYLYFTYYDYILQYDTWANPIDNSRIKIASYDSTYTDSYPFWQIFRMPNNKILIGNYQGSSASYHIIEQPDSAGFACNFQKEALGFLWNQLNCRTIPNTANLKLGALAACDTITTTPKSPKGDLNSQIRAFPNPASEWFFVELPNADTEMELTVFNLTGQLITKKHFVTNTALNAKEWQNGFYQWSVTENAKPVAHGKFVVQH